MMGVSGINHRYNQVEYGKIASGKRINSAKDDAAGAAIAQKILEEEKGLNVASRNTKDGISALNVADGAMAGISDYQQDIHGLSIRAMNGLYSASDRQAIQSEIDGYLDGINQMAVTTKFNERPILDGSMSDMHIASNPDGSGPAIGTDSSTLRALGLEGYSVMGKNINLDAVDKAMDATLASRSRVGAATNGLEHTFNYNANATIQQTSSRSRIEDLDMPEAVSEQKKNKALQDYRFMMQKTQMEQQNNTMAKFM